MGWNYLLILFIVALVVCLCGFYNYVYFLSVGYGFSVAAIGVALAIMCINGTFTGSAATYILSALLLIYGVRLSGFLLIREIKSAAYKKTFDEVSKTEKPMPLFVKITIWLSVAVLYVGQTSPLFFRLYNGAEATALTWVGIIICAFAIFLEATADKQKSAQKAIRPDMVATEGLYKIVRCPNYLGEILFWTGLVISGLNIFTGIGQWLTAIIAYICIVYVMVDGAKRLEKRQMARYGDDEEYNTYANSTPILFPFIPLYHLNKKS